MPRPPVARNHVPNSFMSPIKKFPSFGPPYWCLSSFTRSHEFASSIDLYTPIVELAVGLPQM
ncbi:hypothetical protein DIPPA_27276 [Diplonema papillatum]|nr:hypothetical protein DIPPA_27290 [Diplonema papillatum]KAJ9461451.1 hypothetical protein DIPPA_27276 [Diplonema papillatum]